MSGTGSGNNIIDVDLGKNSKLKELYITNNNLINLDLSNNALLTTLYVDNNQLTELDVSNNVALTYLDASKNQLINLDLSNNSQLIEVDLTENKLTSFICDSNELEKLYLTNNNLISLNLSNNAALTILYAYNNQLTSLNLSNNVALKTLDAYNNQLTELDVSGASTLEKLNVSYNQLTGLNLSNNAALTTLYVDNNQLTELDVKGAFALEDLTASGNQLTELDVSQNVKLFQLSVGQNQLVELNVKGASSLKYLRLDNNQLTKLDVSKNALLAFLTVGNNKLTEIDVSQNTVLNRLEIGGNQLTSLDIGQNLSLLVLWIYSNQLTELDVSNNLKLSSLEASHNQLTKLDVSKNILLTNLDVKYNQLTELDVSQNLLLKTLEVTSNRLINLDLSKNFNLCESSDFSTYTNILSNPYAKEYYVYKNLNGVQIGNPVKIPSHLNWNEPVWISKNDDIAVVDENGLVKLLKVGTVNVVGTSKDSNGSTKYTVTNTINVVEITSDKYKIDEDNSYIFVGSDYDVDVIKNNIKKSSEDIDIDVDMDKYKLYVKYEDEILKEFDIIGLSSKDYDLSKKYIYVKDGKLDLDLINNMNCDKSIEDDKLVIKHGDNVLYEYKLISISSNYYDIKDYIYIGTKDEVDIDKITVINGELSLDNNKLIIKYEDEIVDEIDIVSIKIDIDKIFDKYIYIGHKLDLSKIKTVNCTPYVDGNMLVIKYNNKFIVDTYKLLSFDVRDYNVYGNNIVVLNDVSYDDFTSKINKSDGITYKIYNGEEEVTNGNISVGMEVKIYYDEKIIDTYKITDKNEYVEINNLDVDEDNKVINNIKLGSSIDSIISNINTSGNIKVYNKDNELIEDNSKNIGTGWKIKIELTDSVEEYVISVKGDITGDGISNINDVIKVAKYLTNKDEIVGMEYTNAADITNDGKVNINDVIRLSKTLMGRN